jgi:hypothetical protein
MFDLFVGDVGEYLATIAHTHDRNARLLTDLDVDTGTYYTSLADMGSLEAFQNICLQAREIWYCPPAGWTSRDQQHWTESVLGYVSQWVPCHGSVPHRYQWLTGQLGAGARITDDQQIWAAGCSITAGVGIDPSDRWPALVQQSLGLGMTDLSCAGSSVIWQSDQIIRSPIKSHDIVLWGVTTPQRLCIIQDQSIYHLNARSFDQNPALMQKFSPEVLDNDTLIYHTVLAVKRASQHCANIGAKLIALGLMHDFDCIWRCYDIPEFQQIISWPAQYIDFAPDGLHPGPQQHHKFASEFLKCLR